MEAPNQTTEFSPTSPGTPPWELDNSTATAPGPVGPEAPGGSFLYVFLVAVSLVFACFLLYSFIQTCHAQRRMAGLDCLFWAFSGSQFLLVLLSLSQAACGPGARPAAPLAAVALSFSVNVATLCGLLLLVLMACVLTFDPPSQSLLGRPGVSMALVALASVLSAVVLAAVQWTDGGPARRCTVDPVGGRLSYAVAKLCLCFIIPCWLLLGILATGCLHQWRSRGRFLSGAEEGPVLLTLAAVLFLCQLFYDVVLLRGAPPPPEGGGDAHKDPLRSAAEAALFTGSAVSLLLVLVMHRACRDSLRGALRQLRDCCRSLGGAQTHRHITAPRVEISDTLPDFHSCSLKETAKRSS